MKILESDNKINSMINRINTNSSVMEKGNAYSNDIQYLILLLEKKNQIIKEMSLAAENVSIIKENIELTIKDLQKLFDTMVSRDLIDMAKFMPHA